MIILNKICHADKFLSIPLAWKNSSPNLLLYVKINPLLEEVVCLSLIQIKTKPAR